MDIFTIDSDEEVIISDESESEEVVNVEQFKNNKKVKKIMNFNFDNGDSLHLQANLISKQININNNNDDQNNNNNCEFDNNNNNNNNEDNSSDIEEVKNNNEDNSDINER